MTMLSAKIQRTIRNHYLGFDEEWIEFAICDKDRKLKTTFPLGEYLGSSTETRYDGGRQESWEKPYHFWTRSV